MHDAASGADLTTALLDQWPSYVAYTVTFFLVGAYWINHHRMFNLLRGVNHTFLALNVLFLMAIAIIPFPNALVAEYLLDPESRGVAAATYGIAMFALAALFNIVWWYAYRRGLFKPECNRADLLKVVKSYLVGPIVYALATALSLVAAPVALVIYVVVVFGYWAEGPIGGIDEGYIDAER